MQNLDDPIVVGSEAGRIPLRFMTGLFLGSLLMAISVSTLTRLNATFWDPRDIERLGAWYNLLSPGLSSLLTVLSWGMCGGLAALIFARYGFLGRLSWLGSTQAWIEVEMERRKFSEINQVEAKPQIGKQKRQSQTVSSFQSSAGYFLVELLIGLTILTVAISIVSGYVLATTKARLQSRNAHILARIANDIAYQFAAVTKLDHAKSGTLSVAEDETWTLDPIPPVSGRLMTYDAKICREQSGNVFVMVNIQADKTFVSASYKYQIVP